MPKEKLKTWKNYWKKSHLGIWSEDLDEEDNFFIGLDEEVMREYGLADEFEDDFWDTFADNSHFGRLMRFEIKVNHKPHRFRTKVVWDTETLQTRLIVQQQGVYMGEVLCFILQRCFPIQPKAEDIIWEIVFREPLNDDDEEVKTVKQGWRVVNVVDAELIYEIGLEKLTTA